MKRLPARQATSETHGRVALPTDDGETRFSYAYHQLADPVPTCAGRAEYLRKTEKRINATQLARVMSCQIYAALICPMHHCGGSLVNPRGARSRAWVTHVVDTMQVVSNNEMALE